MKKTNPALELLLKQLKLSSVRDNYRSFAEQAVSENQTYERYLTALIEEEVYSREKNRIKRLISAAKFRKLMLMHEFQFQEVPNLNKPKILQLAEGHFIEKAENICFLGPAGVGKSHLATAISYDACLKNYSVRFILAAELVNELIEAKQKYILSKVQARYRKYRVIIIDELGYIPFSKEGAELLFQFFAERYEKTSIIVTSNLQFSEWTTFLGDPTMTAALLDRFTHHCHIFSIDSDSYRFKNRTGS